MQELDINKVSDVDDTLDTLQIQDIEIAKEVFQEKESVWAEVLRTLTLKELFFPFLDNISPDKQIEILWELRKQTVANDENYNYKKQA